MAGDMERPLSTLVGQGWEVVSFATGIDPAWHTHSYQVLLRRQRNHKILSVRAKSFGRGFAVKEIDV